MPYREFEWNQVTNLHDVNGTTVIVDGEYNPLIPSSREIPRIVESRLAWNSVDGIGLGYWLLASASLVLSKRQEITLVRAWKHVLSE